MIVDHRFAADPIVSHSGQFALARPLGARTVSDVASVPSPLEIRPWNLRGMVTCGVRARGGNGNGTGGDGDGATAGDPSADSVSDNDGDEGRSEDWKHDFAPDYPNPV